MATKLNTPLNTQEVIKDQNAYITVIDNKRLAKIAQINPNKTYNRIQAKNLNKLKTSIQSTMETMLERKRKKLLAQNVANTTNITNQNKIEIIEKAFNACYDQFIYFNKLFLNPVQNCTHNNNQPISPQKKEKRRRINQIKPKIEEKRKLLIQRIQTLNKLKNETKEINVSIPQSIKDKMVKNMHYKGDQSLKQKTESILTMMNNNKKRKMVELKIKFDELKQNEMRLKKRTQRIENDEQMLKTLNELRKKNMMEDNRNHDRSNRVSMASSIASTIHAPISPLKNDVKSIRLSKSKILWNEIEL